jgi:hypothetical protein
VKRIYGLSNGPDKKSSIEISRNEILEELLTIIERTRENVLETKQCGG